MDGWSVLERSDPAPGDVAGTRELGERLLRQASDIAGQTARLRGLATDRGALRMAGDYAGPYGETLAALPGDLSKLALAYHRCGTALTEFAQALGQAKTRAGTALRSGQDADLRYRAALRQLQLLLPAGVGVGSSLSSLSALTPMSVDAVATGLDPATRAQIHLAVRQAQNAGHDLDAARGLADQAAALRNDAEDTCVHEINAALDESGIKNPSWLQREWKAFRSEFTWEHFVDSCRKGALIAGLLALVISGPAGFALAVTAIAAGAVVFSDDSLKYAHGDTDVGVGTLTIDALGLLPGGGRLTGTTRLIRMTNIIRDGISESTQAATITARVTRAATTIGRAATGRSPQTLEDIERWLPDINPGYGAHIARSENCAKTALAVMRRLKGEPSVAGFGTHSVSEMEEITGVKQIKMTPGEIADALKAKGPGTHAIIGIDRSNSFGHWFNAYYDGKQVVAIDGQSGRILGWPPDYDLPGAAVIHWDAGVL